MLYTFISGATGGIGKAFSKELAKKGNIEEYTNFWTSNGVDDSDAYFVWMYNRGPLREEKNNNYPIEPLEDVKNFSPIKFMSYVK